MADNKGLEGRLIELLKQNKVIAAIKLYRESTNAGLKESKDFIDQLMIREGIAVATSAPRIRVRLFLPVLIFSFAAGFVFVVLAGFSRPAILNVATPFVCNGSLRPARENMLSMYGSWGSEPFIYCTDSSGFRRDASLEVFIVSTIIYSLILLAFIMVIAIIKGKKVTDARKKGLSV